MRKLRPQEVIYLLKITQLRGVRNGDLNPSHRLGNQDSERGSGFPELTQLEGGILAQAVCLGPPILSHPPPFLGERTQENAESGQWELGKAGSKCEGEK